LDFSLVSIAATLLGFSAFYILFGAMVNYGLQRKLPALTVAELPLLLVLGVAVWPLVGIILALFGAFVVGSEVFFALIFAVGLPFIALRSKTLLRFIERPQRSSMIEMIVVLAILAISSIYFANLALEIFWAPAGDAVSHATSTAILQQGNLLPTPANAETLLGIPLTPSSLSVLGYPPGFPVSAGIVGLVGGFYPGRSVLVDGALISSVIPLIVFGIARNLTKSVYWSLLSAVLAYLLPDGRFSSWPYHDLLVANFTNGTYPNLMGILILLGVFLIALEKSVDSWHFWIAYAGLLTVYPPFFLYPLLFVAGHWAVLAFQLKKQVTPQTSRAFLSHPAVLSSLILLALGIALRNDVYAFVSSLSNEKAGYGLYAAPSTPDLVRFPFIALLLAALSASAIFILRLPRARPFLVTYLSFALLTVASLNLWLYNEALFITAPGRVIPVLTALTITILLSIPRMSSGIDFLRTTRLWSGVMQLRTLFRIRGPIYHTKIRKIALRLLILVGLSLVVIQPYLQYPPSSGLQVTSSELDVLTAGLPHVPTDSVILNDRSFAGFFLPSVELRKVVNIRSLEGFQYNLLQRALEANRFLNDPGNYNYSAYVLHKWNISFVFISSNPYVLDLLPNGSYSGLAQRAWTPETFIAFLDRNPNLVAVAREGNTGLFRVL